MTAMHTTRRGFLAGSAGLMLALTLPLPKARAAGRGRAFRAERLYPHRHG